MEDGVFLFGLFLLKRTGSLIIMSRNIKLGIMKEEDDYKIWDVNLKLHKKSQENF